MITAITVYLCNRAIQEGVVPDEKHSDTAARFFLFLWFIAFMADLGLIKFLWTK